MSYRTDSRGPAGDRRSTIRERVDRELHTRVVQACESKEAARCTHALYDVRRGRRTPYAGALQVIDHLIAIGASDAAVIAVPETLVAYALECLADRAKGRGSDHPSPTAPARQRAA